LDLQRVAVRESKRHIDVAVSCLEKSLNWWHRLSSLGSVKTNPTISLVWLLIQLPPLTAALSPQRGEREYYRGSFFVPSPPMGERVRVRGKSITFPLPNL
jgi:hypothetical protein